MRHTFAQRMAAHPSAKGLGNVTALLDHKSTQEVQEFTKQERTSLLEHRRQLVSRCKHFVINKLAALWSGVS